MKKWKKKFTQLQFEYLGVDYTADVIVDVVREHNEGADADGNRGVSMDFIDGIEIERVTDLIGESVSNNVWEKMEENIIEAVYKMDLSIEGKER